MIDCKETCEECNYYTEKYDFKKRDNTPYCVKHNKYIKYDDYCSDYDDTLNCYDCPKSYAKYYDLDDIDHYCKEYDNALLYQQDRSVLYKGDFIEGKQKLKCKYKGVEKLNDKR